MGTAEVFLCVFAGCFVAAPAVINQDGMFPLHHPGFFENLFLFDRNFDFPQYDTIFSSSQTRRPDFHMLGQLPSISGVPTVEVFCDEATLSVLVGKRAGRVVLTADELQLGDNCYSNQDLPNQHAFVYRVDECGTTRVVENGVEAFTNTLWINWMQPQMWGPAPSSVHLSCGHKRLFPHPSVFVSMHPDEGAMTRFNFRAMDASWTGQAKSNIYERGQLIHFQVSAKTGPEQQLFVQSCFVSAFEEPHSRQRHAVVSNKGCASLLDSSHSAVQFVASMWPNVINFVLNTTYVIPELFIHCTVLVSDQGTTPGSKSCNYDVTQFRWEDLSGAKDVCACCGSRCRGLSLKNVPDEAKALLTIGPFVVEDVRSPQHLPETSEAFDNDLMQSDGTAAVDRVGSGSETSGNQFAGTSGDVVVLSQNPAAALALWLPGQLKAGLEQAGDFKEQVEKSLMLKNDPFGEQDSVQKQDSENSQAKKISADELDIFAKLVESPSKIWQAKMDLFGKKSAGEDGSPPPPEDVVSSMDDLEALSESQVRPAIWSKLEFSKGTDGSQTLSYEEEVLRKSDDEGDCATRKRGRRGLRSVFLDLIRRLDKAE